MSDHCGETLSDEVVLGCNCWVFVVRETDVSGIWLGDNGKAVDGQARDTEEDVKSVVRGFWVPRGKGVWMEE